jgi:hypothetical protein
MNNLLNPEVIKAAAQSPLGILSLMCLIVGIVCLGLFRTSPVWAKLAVFLVMLGSVFGFGTAVLREQNPRPAAPEASRDYIIGQWQIQQAGDGGEGRTFVDFGEDGRFTGKQETFDTNGKGVTTPLRGVWQFEKLRKDQFRLSMTYDNGRQWNGTYRILDQDHRYNVEENWVAVRGPR